MPVGIIIGLLSRRVGGWSDRIGPRPFLLIGPAIVAAGCALSALKLDDLWAGAVAPMVLVAVGMALVVSPLTTAVMNAAPEGKSGAASSVNNAASRIAGLMAVAILGAVASLVYMSVSGESGARFGDLVGMGASPALAEAFAPAFSTAMWMAALLALASSISVFIFMRDDPAPEPVGRESSAA
jgi:sugar phosphate permease